MGDTLLGTCPDLADNEEILKYLEFVGGGKKLHKVPSADFAHPHFCPVDPTLFSSYPFGPPSPEVKRHSFAISRDRLYTVDMGEFSRSRARSITKAM